MNGQHNKWILKAANLANGAEVSVHSDLDSIYNTFVMTKANMIVMKYIENPLLIRGSRKADLRLWVLVTDWDPLTVWTHSECYFRVAYSDYDLGSNDMKSHITN